MTVLIVLAAVVALAAASAVLFSLAMRRPALAVRLMRNPLGRRIVTRLSRAGLAAARAKAERGAPAGRRSAVPMTDLEAVIAGQDTAEARRIRAMMAQMNPRQRRELSRMALGPDGLSGLMEGAAEAAASSDAAGMLGRAERRRYAGSPATAERNRAARKSKAVARRRARKKGR